MIRDRPGLTHWVIAGGFLGYLLLLWIQPEYDLSIQLISVLPLPFAAALVWLFGLWRAGWMGLWWLQLALVMTMAWVLLWPTVDRWATDQPDAQHDFSLLQANVLMKNTQKMATWEVIRKADPDVITLHEYGSSWVPLLERVSNYPYYLAYPTDSCCYGVAVFSRYPIADSEVYWHKLRRMPIPTLRLVLDVEGKSLTLFTMHTRSPGGQDKIRSRNRHLAWAADTLRQLPKPLIATGDFNAVPWDVSIRAFKTRSGLQDVRNGYYPTYSDALPVLPIDYIFQSQELHCTQLQTLRLPGSDHVGLLAKFRFER